MTNTCQGLVAILLIAGWLSPALGASVPAPLRGVGVAARTAQNPATGIFTYHYRVMNPKANQGQISLIELDITRNPGEVSLSQQGLSNGPRYSQSTSDDAFVRTPMVPVGVTGPGGWLYGLGFDSASNRGFVLWGSSDEAYRIAPGAWSTGFQLDSHGLPGLRQIEVLPDLNVDDLPDEFSEPEKVRSLKESLTFRAMTVGPKAPPDNFVALEFLNYLISLLHDSRQQGWIKVDGVHQSLLAKLINAKRKLESGETAAAKHLLNAFLNEVHAVSCSGFTCPGNKPLTSEAYALLFFNGQFLQERLP